MPSARVARRIIGACAALASLCGGAVAAPFVAAAAGVPANVVVTVVPNAPAGLSASASSQSQVDLSWTDASNNETYFLIERSVGGNANFVAIATTSANVAVYSNGGLSASTIYFYRVAAVNGDGASSYSSEASTTTPSAPLPPPPAGGSGGGGGGGGGGGFVAPPIFQTGAIFRGVAYPKSSVTLLQNAQVVAVSEAGPDAKFEIRLAGAAPGKYNFGVWAADPAGNRSIVQTFSVELTNGATTVVSGIFFAPTIAVDKKEVKRGDILNVLGYSAPEATISVIFNSANEIVKNLTADEAGSWLYKMNTSVFAYGDHTVRAWAATGDGDVTTDSDLVSFVVGDRNVQAPAPAPCSTTGNLNDDCKVNLVDFSIMAYWYQRPDPPAAIDLNGDGIVDLVDFSILAYHWTG